MLTKIISTGFDSQTGFDSPTRLFWGVTFSHLPNAQSIISRYSFPLPKRLPTTNLHQTLKKNTVIQLHSSNVNVSPKHTVVTNLVVGAPAGTAILFCGLIFRILDNFYFG